MAGAASHGKIVVVKYGGNAMIDDELQGAPSPPTWCSCATSGIQPGRRARRRPADHRDARPARHRQRVQGRPAGHHAGGDGRGPDGAGRSGRPRAGRADQRARPATPSACPARTPGCSPRCAARRYVDGEAVDIGLVGDVAAVNADAVLDLIAAGRIPVISTVAPGRRRGGAQPQRRHRRRRAGRGARAPRSWSCSPTSRACTRDWPDRDSLVSADRRRRAGGAAARRWSGHGARRWRPACGRCAAACRSAHVDRRPGAALACCWRSSPTKGSERWWCPR